MEPTLSSFLGKTVFNDLRAVDENNVPNKLLFREDELSKLGRFTFSRIITGKKPESWWVLGEPGTGKTVSARHWEKEVKAIKPVGVIYVNCSHDSSMMGIYANMISQIQSSGNIKRMKRKGDYKRKLVELLEDVGQKSYVIILDEIDKLRVQDATELIRSLTRFHEIDPSISFQVGVICISNDLTIKKKLEAIDKSAISSFGDLVLIYHRYKQSQLLEILKQRAKRGFKRGMMPSSILRLISEYTAPEGDARKAIRFLRVIGNIADSEGATKITEKHFEEAKQALLSEEIKPIIMDMGDHSRLLLTAIVKLQASGKITPFHKHVYYLYQHFCKEQNIEPLSDVRARQLCNDLSATGLITRHAKTTTKSREIYYFVTPPYGTDTLGPVLDDAMVGFELDDVVSRFEEKELEIQQLTLTEAG